MSDENLSSIAIPVRHIKTGKRTLTPGGKPRLNKPERGGKIVPLEGQLGAPTHQRRASKLIPHDPTRQGIETQMRALKAKIERDLQSVVSLYQHGRTDKAIVTCGIIATSRNLLVALAQEYAEALSAKPVEATETAQKSRIKVVTKVRRYKTFSDK